MPRLNKKMAATGTPTASGQLEPPWTMYNGLPETEPPHGQLLVFWLERSGFWGGGWYHERKRLIRMWGTGCGTYLEYGDCWRPLPPPPQSRLPKGRKF